MVEKTRFYNSLENRQAIIDEEIARGFSLLHDDFKDINGNDTDGKSGRLIFTNTTQKETRQSKSLTDALMEILKERGVDSDQEIAKFKRILDKEP